MTLTEEIIAVHPPTQHFPWELGPLPPFPTDRGSEFEDLVVEFREILLSLGVDVGASDVESSAKIIRESSIALSLRSLT